MAFRNTFKFPEIFSLFKIHNVSLVIGVLISSSGIKDDWNCYYRTYSFSIIAATKSPNKNEPTNVDMWQIGATNLVKSNEISTDFCHLD